MHAAIFGDAWTPCSQCTSVHRALNRQSCSSTKNDMCRARAKADAEWRQQQRERELKRAEEERQREKEVCCSLLTDAGLIYTMSPKSTLVLECLV